MITYKIGYCSFIVKHYYLFLFFRAFVHHPQRLQTVLELYSQDLKGLVLFIDTNNLDFYSGLSKGNLLMQFSIQSFLRA